MATGSFPASKRAAIWLRRAHDRGRVAPASLRGGRKMWLCSLSDFWTASANETRSARGRVRSRFGLDCLRGQVCILGVPRVTSTLVATIFLGMAGAELNFLRSSMPCCRVHRVLQEGRTHFLLGTSTSPLVRVPTTKRAVFWSPSFRPNISCL